MAEKKKIVVANKGLNGSTKYFVYEGTKPIITNKPLDLFIKEFKIIYPEIASAIRDKRENCLVDEIEGLDLRTNCTGDARENFIKTL